MFAGGLVGVASSRSGSSGASGSGRSGGSGGAGNLPKFLSRFRNRLLLLNLISLAVVIVLSFLIIYLILSAHMHQTDNSRLNAIPSDVIRNAMFDEMASEGVDTDRRDGNLYNLNGGVDLPIDYGKCFVINVDANGSASVFSRIEGMTNDDFLAAIQAVIAHGSKSGRVELDGVPWLFRLSKVQGSDSIVFLNVEDTDGALARLLVSMIAVGIVVLALFYFLSRSFANRAMRPAAESFEKQRRFVADASHELKTPLAIIDANAEAALSVIDAKADAALSEEPSGDQPDDQARLFVGRIEEESGRMRGLIDSLLYLARTEDAASMGDDSELLPMDLSAAAEEEIERIEAVLFERGIGLEYLSAGAKTLLVKADGQYIRQAILILLDNAMKYTDVGGKVTVETGITGRSTDNGSGRASGYGSGRIAGYGSGRTGFIRVTNTGAGIAREDLPHIFDRFYRADKSRHSSGYGLGLSIADTIVRRSGGQIKAASEGGLTTFTIELPLA
jgi:signal transduction histidine kinase